MTEYTVREFCDLHGACTDGRGWADAQGLLDGPMSALWQRDDLRHDWREWIATRRGVCSDSGLRLYACRCVRETSLADGRKVWDLLTDERSRTAVAVAERYARGEATAGELAAAWAAARAAAWDAARDAAWAAAWDAARDAARDAAWAAARAAARAAQNGWLRELPVCFEKEG